MNFVRRPLLYSMGVKDLRRKKVFDGVLKMGNALIEFFGGVNNGSTKDQDI